MVVNKKRCDFWFIGKYKGETLIGRYLVKNGRNNLSGISSSGSMVCVPLRKVIGIKKLKINSMPSPYKITAELQNNIDKSEEEISIDMLLNLLNTY